MKLRILTQARERIEVARAWWQSHRDKAPLLFDEELVEALDSIAETPALGQRLVRRNGSIVQRRLMPKTAFHVYYEVVGDEIWVLSIWGAVRGDRPRLQ